MNTLELTVPAKGNTPAVNAPVLDVASLDTAKPLEEIFQPFETVLTKWEAKAQSLIVTDINQKTEMQQARLARLELKEARVAMDKTRLGLVAGLKARTTKIDATARLIRGKMEELEEQLKASEEFAERHAAKVKAELKLARETELMPLLESPIAIDLSTLAEDQWAKTLADAKLLRQAKIDAAAKAEAERLAKEESDRVERARIAAENERLKAEAAEVARVAEVERKRIEAERAEEQRKAKEERDRIEAERAAERKKAEAEAARVAEVARKELEAIEAKAREEAATAAKEAARLKAELAAKAKEEAEEKARIEAERLAADKAAKKAAAAPDKAKVALFAGTLRDMARLKLNDEPLSDAIWTKVNELAEWCESTAEKL